MCRTEITTNQNAGNEAMTTYIKKSFSIGPLRFNLSKSGLGVSVGTTGARVGVKPNGKVYHHAGRHGLYNRKEYSDSKGCTDKKLGTIEAMDAIISSRPERDSVYNWGGGVNPESSRSLLGKRTEYVTQGYSLGDSCRLKHARKLRFELKSKIAELEKQYSKFAKAINRVNNSSLWDHITFADTKAARKLVTDAASLKGEFVGGETADMANLSRFEEWVDTIDHSEFAEKDYNGWLDSDDRKELVREFKKDGFDIDNPKKGLEACLRDVDSRWLKSWRSKQKGIRVNRAVWDNQGGLDIIVGRLGKLYHRILDLTVRCERMFTRIYDRG